MEMHIYIKAGIQQHKFKEQGEVLSCEVTAHLVEVMTFITDNHLNSFPFLPLLLLFSTVFDLSFPQTNLRIILLYLLSYWLVVESCFEWTPKQNCSKGVNGRRCADDPYYLNQISTFVTFNSRPFLDPVDSQVRKVPASD